MPELTPLYPPDEQFRNSPMVARNRYLVPALQPLFVLRSELIANDEFTDRGGTNTPTRTHLLNHLVRCDAMRRRVTHNPSGVPLEVIKLEAKDVEAIKGTTLAGSIDSKLNPFGGDEIQNQSGGLIDLSLIYRLDGGDPNIPLMSQLTSVFRASVGGTVLMGVDDAINMWLRCNSAMRTTHFTIEDSIRILGRYQAIYDYLRAFTGDDNRIDVAQRLPSQEPRGPQASPNLAGENSGAALPS
jgi:hypothetical protein